MILFFQVLGKCKGRHNIGVGWPNANEPAPPRAGFVPADIIFSVTANTLLVSEHGLGFISCSNAEQDLKTALVKCGSIRWPYGRGVSMAVKEDHWPNPVMGNIIITEKQNWHPRQLQVYSFPKHPLKVFLRASEDCSRPID